LSCSEFVRKSEQDPNKRLITWLAGDRAMQTIIQETSSAYLTAASALSPTRSAAGGFFVSRSIGWPTAGGLFQQFRERFSKGRVR
jgi:hypothetical protein